MLPIRVAVLSGYTGPRSSMFAGGASDIFGLGSSRPMLGKDRSPQNWFEYAKNEIRQYDEFLTRARKIAYKDAREEIVKDYYGDPSDADSASFRRDSVQRDVQQAEAYTPVNYWVFDNSTVQGRVEKLNDWNKDFIDAVKDAENRYGSLPAPQVIEMTKLVETSTTPGWVAPVVIGSLALAGLAAFGVFGKK